MKRRLFALLMSLVMLLGLLPMSALADEPAASDLLTPSEVTKNGITLTKTATRTGDDEWEINLGVETTQKITQQKAEVIFVLDTSGSMAWCTTDEELHTHSWENGCYQYKCTDPNHYHYTGKNYEHIGGTTCKEFGRGKDRAWYKLTCTKLEHEHSGGVNCSKVNNSSTNSADWDRLKQSVAAINEASKNLKDTLHDNVSIKYVTFSSTNYSNHLDVYNESSWSSAELKAEGGTYLTSGVRKAIGQFSSDSSTKKFLIIVADGEADVETVKNNKDHDTSLPKYPTTDADDFKKAGGTIYTIGMMFSSDDFTNLASDGCSTTVGSSLDMTRFLGKVTDSIAALINDPMGDDVSVAGKATVTVNNGAGTSLDPQDNDKLLKWNQDKLESGSTVSMTYRVKLDQITVGDHSSILLNGDAKLNYSYDDNGTTKNESIAFPVPSASYKAASLEVAYQDTNGTQLANPYNSGAVITDYSSATYTPGLGYTAPSQTLPYAADATKQYKLKSSTLYIGNDEVLDNGNKITDIAAYLDAHTVRATVAYKVVNVYELADITPDPDTYTVIYKWADNTEVPSDAALPAGNPFTVEVGTTHTVAAVPTSGEMQNAAGEYGKWTCAWDKSGTVSGTASEEITITGTWTFTPNQLTIVKEVKGANLINIPDLTITATFGSNTYSLTSATADVESKTETYMSQTFNAPSGQYTFTETDAEIGGKKLTTKYEVSTNGGKTYTEANSNDLISVLPGKNTILKVTNTYSDPDPTTSDLTVIKSIDRLPGDLENYSGKFLFQLKDNRGNFIDSAYAVYNPQLKRLEAKFSNLTIGEDYTLVENKTIAENVDKDYELTGISIVDSASVLAVNPFQNEHTVTIKEKSAENVYICTNTYKVKEQPGPGTLTIEKTLNVTPTEATSYKFTVTRQVLDTSAEWTNDSTFAPVTVTVNIPANETSGSSNGISIPMILGTQYVVEETSYPSSFKVSGGTAAYSKSSYVCKITPNEGNNPVDVGGKNAFYVNQAVYAVKITCENNYEITPDPDTYTLAYDANGGTGAPASESKQSTTGSADFTVSSTKPTRSNHTFLGWSLDRNATSASYTAGMMIEVNDSDTNRTKTLYAVWAKDNTPEEPERDDGTLVINKTDANDGSKLSGAFFEIYKQVGGKWVFVCKIRTTNGYASTGLDNGKYYAVEVEAPEGYTLDTTEHYFTINNNTVTLSLTNDKTSTPGILTDDHFAYIIGYTDGTVQPGGNITRAEVATIFFRLLRDDVREEYMTSSNPFSDVREGKWFNHAISTLYSLDILNGYEDGKFHPNATITRAEFAAIAARFSDKKVSVGNAPFSDIQNHWAKDEITYAAALGWVNGYTDGTFKPNQPITRAEAMTLVNRVLNRNPKSVDDLLDNMIKWPDNMNTAKWYYLAVQEATNSHDYERSGSSEYWTKLQSVRDWAALEY